MRTLVGILGFVLGIVAGAGLILVNPLAWLNDLPPLPAERAPAKAYHADDYRGMETGVADLLGVASRNRQAALMDSALAHVRIGVVVLAAGKGTPAALAVKVSTIAEENSLWRAQLGTYDNWNIFWPGEGSVFASGYSNFWGVTRDALLAAAAGGDREFIDAEYPVSAPSPLQDSTGVIGASGRYAGFTGEIRELLYPAPPDSSKSDPDWGLALEAKPPAVKAR